MMKEDTGEMICPFCEQGVLKKRKCTTCKKNFLLCDECESVYKDDKELEEELGFICPYCGAGIAD